MIRKDRVYEPEMPEYAQVLTFYLDLGIIALYINCKIGELYD